MGRYKTSNLKITTTKLSPEEHDQISTSKLSVHGVIKRGLQAMIDDQKAKEDDALSDKYGMPPEIFFADMAWSREILRKWVKRSFEEPRETGVISFPIYKEMGFTKEQVEVWIELTLKGHWKASFSRALEEERVAVLNRVLRRSDKPTIKELLPHEKELYYQEIISIASSPKEAEECGIDTEYEGVF